MDTEKLDTLIVGPDEVLILRMPEEMEFEVESVSEHLERMGLGGRAMIVTHGWQMAKVKREDSAAVPRA